jgi:hypothetical protein
MCFVGHGAFGVMTKAAWVPYFAVVGIGPGLAYKFMPLIGALDIALGCSMLVAPVPIVVGWMAIWAVWTAALRPLSGESAWEAVERAGNYGIPVALLLLMAPRRAWLDLFRPDRFRELTPHLVARVRLVLIVTVVLLIVGHGVTCIAEKPAIVANYASVFGMDSAPSIVKAAGWFEIALALAVAVRPFPALLIGACVWKLLTESLFVVAGSPVWEVVERGGSYAAPLALAIVIVIADSNGRWSANGVRRR